jgi:hypothetical protein
MSKILAYIGDQVLKFNEILIRFGGNATISVGFWRFFGGLRFSRIVGINLALNNKRFVFFRDFPGEQNHLPYLSCQKYSKGRFAICFLAAGR